MKTLFACLIFAVLMIVMLMGCAPDLDSLLGAIKCDVTIPEQEVTRDGPTVLKEVELKCRRGKR